MKHLTSLALLITGMTACADSAFVTEAERVEGIYQLQLHTLNTEACLPGGEPVVGTDGYAIARQREVLGLETLEVWSCASPAECRTKLADFDRGQPQSIDFMFTVYSVESAGTLSGRGADTGYNRDGVCTSGGITTTQLAIEGDALRIEQGFIFADDYPQPKPNTCTTDAAERAAAGNSCAQLEILTAVRVEAL